MTPAVLFKNNLSVLFWAVCFLMSFGMFRKSSLFTKVACHTQKQCIHDSFISITNKWLSVVLWTGQKLFSTENVNRKWLPVIYPHPLCPVMVVCELLQTNAGQARKTLAFLHQICPIWQEAEGNDSGGGKHFCSEFLPKKGMLPPPPPPPSKIMKIMGDWKCAAYLSWPNSRQSAWPLQTQIFSLPTTFLTYQICPTVQNVSSGCVLLLFLRGGGGGWGGSSCVLCMMLRWHG